MKVFLLLAVCLLSLHNGKGAPRTAVYNFVRCNPEDGDANCVTQQTQEMEWSPDLPAKLPASTAQYLEAEPVEDESPAWREEEVEEEEDEDEDEGPQMEEDEDDDWEMEDEDDEEDEMYEENDKPEEGESPLSPPSEESSGVYEGSTGEGVYADEVPAENGSGEFWTEKAHKVGGLISLRRLFPSMSLAGQTKPEDLKEDQILQL